MHRPFHALSVFSKQAACFLPQHSTQHALHVVHVLRNIYTRPTLFVLSLQLCSDIKVSDRTTQCIILEQHYVIAGGRVQGPHQQQQQQPQQQQQQQQQPVQNLVYPPQHVQQQQQMQPARREVTNDYSALFVALIGKSTCFTGRMQRACKIVTANHSVSVD